MTSTKLKGKAQQANLLLNGGSNVLDLEIATSKASLVQHVQQSFSRSMKLKMHVKSSLPQCRRNYRLRLDPILGGPTAGSRRKRLPLFEE
ncbi:hypothetical protein KIN20_027651 [Parelaphostrongylus tenuis]|uniref:Uncharacterized protein n=1 Tax=Parelaphostrongylus tenuis TaxID=148309 RepID=A0AAD5QZM6_PARTN|nr:hypothetical protein KIN20_027651 [Parelaphostrongylus tenuis]